jgi:AcrR family transcriptional regulator
MRGETSLSPATDLATRRSERAERKRQRILDSAGHCFAERGFAKTTMDEIAQRAGVSKGLVYSHFSGKEGLLEQVMERTLAEWDEAASEVERSATGVLDALAISHRAAMEYARTNPLLRTLLAEDDRVLLVGLGEVVRPWLEKWREGLIGRLREGIRAGELRMDLDVEATADVIRALQGGLIDLLTRPGHVDATTPQVLEASVEFMLHGIACPGSGAEPGAEPGGGQ